MRQRVSGGDYATSYDELRSVHALASPVFERTMGDIVRAAGLAPDEPAMHEGKPLVLDASKGLNFSHLTIAPAKGRARCEEKAANEYGGDYSQIVDVVRCSIVVETEEELLVVAERLASGGGSVALLNGKASAVGGFVLVRLKNRFAKPLFNGYQVGERPTGHGLAPSPVAPAASSRTSRPALRLAWRTRSPRSRSAAPHRRMGSTASPSTSATACGPYARCSSTWRPSSRTRS